MPSAQPPEAGAEGPPSLYEWAGGGQALQRLFTEFYGLVLRDDLLRPVFEHMSPEHPHNVATWFGEVFGGPDDYTRHHGGHPAMLRHHLNLAITEEQRRRWIDLLIEAADIVQLPDDPEFRASFLSYIEWGTRLGKEFSQPGATPHFDEPVPIWHWVRQPWQG